MRRASRNCEGECYKYLGLPPPSRLLERSYYTSPPPPQSSHTGQAGAHIVVFSKSSLLTNTDISFIGLEGQKLLHKLGENVGEN